MRSHGSLRVAALAVVVLLAGAPAATAVDSTETIRRSFTLAPSAGARSVEIDNVFGSVHVRGSDGDRVEVVVTQTLHAEDQAAHDRARSEVKLGVVETPGRLVLAQDGPFRHDGDENRRGRHHRRSWDPDYEVSWNWEITLPRDAALEVSSVNGGTVHIERVSGRLAAANVNGDVKLEEVGGRTEASTVNGNVEVLFAEMLAEPAEFSTVNGEIDLSFPRGFGAELEFSTLHGEIYSDFEVGPAPVAARVESESNGRGRSFRVGRESAVRLGAGGPRLACSTINGDILIRER